MIRSRSRFVLCAAAALALACAAPGSVQEASASAFLAESQLELRQVHEGGRFPNIVVTLDGTVLAVWGGVRVRRSEDGGVTWGPSIAVGDGFMGGGVIVDERSGDVLAFVEESHPPAPLTIYRSTDDGRSWAPSAHTLAPDANGHMPSMHMNEAGLTLRRGPYAGRLLRAARHYAGRNHADEWPNHYTTAIYSDDGGRSWRTSAPFADMGTGEAALVELADGSLYYNSRAHWYERPDERPLRRRAARSTDGGATWTDWRIVETLPDGPQDTNYGCMGGLVRLPIAGEDVLLYSNCDSPAGRHHGTVWASFDGGRTWPLKRLVHAGSFAYSSLAAGRPGTPSAGWIYLAFEGDGCQVARFNLTWVLGGEPTGDGRVPAAYAAR